MWKKSYILLLLLFCASIIEAASLKIVRRNLDLPGWQEAHRDLKIMYICDLHLREEVMADELFTIALPKAVKKEKPHILLIGGDLFQYRTDDYAPIMKDFKKIIHSLPDVPLGIYAILGNHEEPRPSPALAALKKAGIKTLRDSFVKIPFNGKTFVVWGLQDNRLENAYIRENTLNKILKIKKPTFILSHRPASYPQIPAEIPALLLSGHTHGGVVHLPGLPRGTLTKLMKHGHTGDYVYGWFETGNKKMYVSCGMGGKGYSGARFNNPPEALVLTFRKK